MRSQPALFAVSCKFNLHLRGTLQLCRTPHYSYNCYHRKMLTQYLIKLQMLNYLQKVIAFSLGRWGCIKNSLWCILTEAGVTHS